METKSYENLSKGALIKADLYSRTNAMNGKYRAGNLGLDNLAGIKDKDIFFLETLKMKADLADKMIDEAISQHRNINDPEVMKELGEEINAVGTPIHRNEAVMTAIWDALFYIIIYGITFGIWGLVFGKSFSTFFHYGNILGFLISLLVAPVIACQRTKQKIKDMSFGAGAIWGFLIIWIGILGLIVWTVKSIFF